MTRRNLTRKLGYTYLRRLELFMTKIGCQTLTYGQTRNIFLTMSPESIGQLIQHIKVWPSHYVYRGDIPRTTFPNGSIGKPSSGSEPG